jgi:uncharacterized Zn finger protein
LHDLNPYPVRLLWLAIAKFVRNAGIASVSDLSSYEETLIRRVMEKAVETNPDWVIDNATRRAESIMDRGKADAYDCAVDWLKLARAAYQGAGRQSDWSAYRTQLMQTHARKYKLMAMLKAQDLA